MHDFTIFMTIVFGLIVLATGLGFLLKWLSNTHAGRAVSNSKDAKELADWMKAIGLAAMVAIPLTPITLLILLMAGAPKGDNTLHWAWGITSVLLVPICFRQVQEKIN